MINQKIDKLISELEKGRDILAENNSHLETAIRKLLTDICKELIEIKQDIESEKAIENCKVKQLALKYEIGDCGIENGKCIGYANSGGEPYEECRNCCYGGFEEEE